ncbi:MAG: hypothetical protein IH808_14170 [Proteobacteria bacterium]|nr:hypothetical protein [Pseudomonadota bacterium]
MFFTLCVVQWIRNDLITSKSSGRTDYAYDLSDIATYQQYQRLMAHWRRELRLSMYET